MSTRYTGGGQGGDLLKAQRREEQLAGAHLSPSSLRRGPIFL
jgi:hypothetical protein